MGFDEGRIVLDSPNMSYYTGQTIFGKLEFQQDKTKTFRGIYVKAHGFAEVHWTTSHQRRVNGKTEHYTRNHNAHEEYFSTKQYLVGSENGDYHLKPGQHVFPFQVHIPQHCPSSFEGAYGRIRYEIKVVVDRAFKLDQEKKIRVQVICPLNLNNDPTCLEPAVFEFNDNYSCCCSGSGTVETTVKIPVSGYCPGQVIPVEVSCVNTSTTDIHNIKLIIRKVVKYYAHHDPGTKVEKETVAEIKKGPIASNVTRNWTVEMPVPVVDCYNVDQCRIIDVGYYFKVTVNPEGCHSDSSASKLIKIGTVPIVGFQDTVPNPLQDQMPNPQAVQDTNSVPAFNPQYTDFPGQTVPTQPPYPVPAPPYPGPTPPYPGSNPPYPGSNPPYPGSNPPYPGSNPPYPGSNPPYPGSSPPYPGSNPPYPASNPPYPAVHAGPTPYLPQPAPFGFKSNEEKQKTAPPSMPLLPNMPPGQPYSAPEPLTPDVHKNPEAKPLMDSEASSPYNPDFMKAGNN